MHFILSGDVLLVLFLPLTLWARCIGLDPHFRFWATAIALAGLYARAWDTLDRTKTLQDIVGERTPLPRWLRHFGELYNGTALFFDLLVSTFGTNA